MLLSCLLANETRFLYFFFPKFVIAKNFITTKNTKLAHPLIFLFSAPKTVANETKKHRGFYLIDEVKSSLYMEVL